MLSLLPSGTEMVAVLLGVPAAGRRLIGVSEYCDWPAALVSGLPVVIRSAVALTPSMTLAVSAPPSWRP